MEKQNPTWKPRSPKQRHSRWLPVAEACVPHRDRGAPDPHREPSSRDPRKSRRPCRAVEIPAWRLLGDQYGNSWDTLWLFNIAMELGPFLDDILSYKPPLRVDFFMAMSNNQMVSFPKRSTDRKCCGAEMKGLSGPFKERKKSQTRLQDSLCRFFQISKSARIRHRYKLASTTE